MVQKQHVTNLKSFNKIDFNQMYKIPNIGNNTNQYNTV